MRRENAERNKQQEFVEQTNSSEDTRAMQPRWLGTGECCFKLSVVFAAKVRNLRRRTKLATGGYFAVQRFTHMLYMENRCIDVACRLKIAWRLVISLSIDQTAKIQDIHTINL